MSCKYNRVSQLFKAVHSWQLRRGAAVVIFPCFVQTNISQAWLPISIIGMYQSMERTPTGRLRWGRPTCPLACGTTWLSSPCSDPFQSRSYETREQASTAPRLCLNTLIFSRLQAAMSYFFEANDSSTLMAALFHILTTSKISSINIIIKYIYTQVMLSV